MIDQILEIVIEKENEVSIERDILEKKEKLCKLVKARSILYLSNYSEISCFVFLYTFRY